MPSPDDSVIALAAVDAGAPLVSLSESSDLSRRRSDVDAKQSVVAEVLAEMQCEAAVLLMPAHVAWFTSGINIRGLIADAERPGIYTTGQQRWLLCSNVDTIRLFHEELDGLGFQLKEWQWKTGRPTLLGELVVGKRIAVDRPYPSLPLINDRLRLTIRPLSSYELDRYLALGELLTHAVEATARTFDPGETEEEIAGQVAHRLYHHGAEAVGLSVAADGRGARYRRAGFTATPAGESCLIQATAARDGLYATCSRTVTFGPPSPSFKAEHDLACKVGAAFRSRSRPGQTLGTAGDAGAWVLGNTPYEFDWRFSQPGYGAGRYAAEELRRNNFDEPFLEGQPLVWQARVGAAAAVDTVIAFEGGPLAVTGPELWPFKRIRIRDNVYDVPDLLVRE